MNNELRLAARLTAANLKLDTLADKLAAEQARTDQLQAAIVDLHIRIGRLERNRELRQLTIQRLRGRLQAARISRDLWKHRALRGPR